MVAGSPRTGVLYFPEYSMNTHPLVGPCTTVRLPDPRLALAARIITLLDERDIEGSSARMAAEGISESDVQAVLAGLNSGEIPKEGLRVVWDITRG
jgi:hypothetical protein